MDKYIGRLLDNRYEILEVIGTGGMAVVYKARCHKLNRLVAIKILKDDFLQDEEFRRRFYAESQAIAMLSHPNIVSVYDVSASADVDFIVMELIDGITLKQYMEKKGVLNWKETLHFAIQIAKALEHAHSRGIVHRDIKPHNVMVLKNGSVKVADFGIARMMSEGNTLTKEALGSVHYISPEQAKGGRVDNRSDIYSLGAVLYEMISGRPPYDGDSPVAVAIQHINGGAVMPSLLNPNIPGGLEQIIMKAMAQDADNRYTTATAMLNDLDEFRKNPAILFDYHSPQLDEVAVLKRPAVTPVAEHKPVQEQPVRRPERKKTDGVQQNKRKPARRTENRPSPDEGKSRAATIAISACSLAMVAAIVIFLVVLFNGGLFGISSNLVQVPNLTGKDYANLPVYTDFEIVFDKEIHHDTVPEGQIVSHKPDAGEWVGRGNKIYVTVSLGQADTKIYMPDVVGQEQRQVQVILENMSIRLQVSPKEVFDDTIPAGYIVRTEPVANAELNAGDVITLYVSMGPNIKVSQMPNIIGETQDGAIDTLKRQDLDLNIEIEEVFDNTVDAGKVIRTEPYRGEDLKTGQTVVLYISKGAETAVVPNVVGMTRSEAIKTLGDKGFDFVDCVMVADKAPYGTVLSQSQEKLTEISVLTMIILEISNGEDDTPMNEATEPVPEVTENNPIA